MVNTNAIGNQRYPTPRNSSTLHPGTRTSNSANSRPPNHQAGTMRLLLATFLLLFAALSTAVKREDFKECSQTSFCRRLRSLSTKQETSGFTSPYKLGKPSKVSEAAWVFPLSSSLYPDISFTLRVAVLDQGIVRIRADEVGSVSPWRRYNETAKWALDGEPTAGSATIKTKDGVSTLSYGDGLSLEIQASPLRVTMKRNGVETVVFNERSLFHVEHYRTKEIEDVVETEDAGIALTASDTGVGLSEEDAQKPLAVPETPEPETGKVDKVDRSWFEDDDKDAFEETWKRWRDTKPKGGW